jgi:HEAT repeat protein
VSTAGSDGVPYVRRLADDPDPEVRHAAVGALSGLRLPVAAQALADVAARGEHLDERQRAITALGEHPAQNAGALLEGLVGGRGADKLPRALRKRAKAAAQARRQR